jgi:N12 class adenine-specific DNA methylase
MRQHQSDAIARGVQEQNVLLAHRVGYGKSAEQVGIIMESRRLGLANKPLWIVMENMIDEIPRQFMQLYPMARLMVPTKRDMTPQGRQEFFARAAMSDPDCIIMTHDQFLRLEMSIASRRQLLQDEIDQM